MNKVITRNQALEAIDALMLEHVNKAPLSANLAEVVAFAVNNDLQVRDYVLGLLPETLTAQGAISFVSDLLPLVAETDRVPFYSVLSAFYSEAGDNDLAHASLFTAQSLDPDYSLAKLLSRVLASGMPMDFASMRAELHPKVVAELNESRELVIL